MRQTHIYDVKLRRVVVSRLLVNIMPLSTLKAVGILRERLVKQPVQVLGFRGNASFNVDFINLNLTIGHMRAAEGFHVIDAWTAYNCC